MKTDYDVCIIGSGAGGGMAAYMLTQAGADVVLLEAGGPWDNTKDSVMLKWPHESPLRGASTKARPFGEFDACIGGWDIAGEPYTGADGTLQLVAGADGGRPHQSLGTDFTPLWARDFRARSLDGLGDDWPIGYDDIRPYYDQVDRLVGVFGSIEGLRNHPDGIFLPPPRPRCFELLVKQACDRLAIACSTCAGLGSHPAPQRPSGVPLLRPV